MLRGGGVVSGGVGVGGGGVVRGFVARFYLLPVAQSLLVARPIPCVAPEAAYPHYGEGYEYYFVPLFLARRHHSPTIGKPLREAPPPTPNPIK